MLKSLSVKKVEISPRKQRSDRIIVMKRRVSVGSDEETIVRGPSTWSTDRNLTIVIARFAGNVHIVKPSTKDFSLNLPLPRSTFPKPLPPFLPRHLSAPSASLPLRDPASANAGRYSLSLKGVRRELRKSGPGAEQIVLDIEQELTEWLETGGVLLFPDSRRTSSSLAVSGTPLGSSKSIIEVCRSPTELIWRIDEDFPRFLLHCVARFHGVVSFSKYS